MRPIKQKIQLKLQDGHYYTQKDRIGESDVVHHVITARGFQYINRFAGVSLIRPDTLKDDNGTEVSNPIIQRDENHMVKAVRTREMAIARCATGALRAVDLTVTYDVRAAQANEILNLWLDNGKPDWGQLSNQLHAMKTLENTPSRSAIALTNGVWLVYSLDCPEVLGLLHQHAQENMTADAAAASITTRNLLRRHFGFRHTDEDGSVTITTWQGNDVDWANFDYSQLENVITGSEDVTVNDDKPVVATGSDLREYVKANFRDWRIARDKAQPALKKHSVNWGDLGQADASVISDVYRELTS